MMSRSRAVGLSMAVSGQKVTGTDGEKRHKSFITGEEATVIL